jgi:RNA polymerase sigma-70 factor (ECF subfamily)
MSSEIIQEVASDECDPAVASRDPRSKAQNRTPSPRDKADFEREMVVHLDSLYRAALGMTRDKGDAEDLVQDTFVRAFQFYAQYQGGTNGRAWLFRIMTNLYINGYRKKHREPERVSYDELEDFYLYNRLSDAQSRGAGTAPETEVVLRVEADAIKEAVEKLPDEYRDTVILADLQEFSYQEISEMLQIPIGTVRSRLSRGRRLVQKAIWAYTEENMR